MAIDFEHDGRAVDPSEVSENDFKKGKENHGLRIVSAQVSEDGSVIRNPESSKEVKPTEEVKEKPKPKPDPIPKPKPKKEKKKEEEHIKLKEKTASVDKKINGLKGYVKKSINEIKGQVDILHQLDDLAEGELADMLNFFKEATDSLDAIGERVDALDKKVDSISNPPTSEPAAGGDSSEDFISLAKNFEFDVDFKWYDDDAKSMVGITLQFNLHLPLPSVLSSGEEQTDLLILGFRDDSYPEQVRDLTRALDYIQENDISYSVVVGSNTDQQYEYSNCSTLTNFFECGYIEGGMILFGILASNPE